MTRFISTEAHELECKIFDLRVGKTNEDDFKIAMLICDIVKDELYNNQDRMDSYKAWNDIQNLLIQQKNI